MFVGDLAQYLSVGRSAMDNIRGALLASGAMEAPRRIRDLPCGHGRVQRWMRVEWPDAEIVAVEIDRDGVDFCVAKFGAEGVYSSNPLSAVEVGTGFDLIFAGSLLTHFDAPRFPEVLEYFRDRLAPTGVAIVTTHGERSAQLIESVPLLVPTIYALSVDDGQAVLACYRATGFGYAEFPNSSTPGYGISLASPEWMRRQLTATGVREVFFAPHGWDRHQDVWGFVTE